jgi:MFS family permease
MKAIGYLTLASTTFLTIATLGPDFVTSVIGLDKEDIGAVVAPAGAGILIGVLTVPRVVRRVGRRWLISISMMLAGLMMAAMALSRGVLDWIIVPGQADTWLVVAFIGGFAAILGISNAYILVPSQTMLQERSHEAIRARVYGTLFTISNSVAFVPIFFAAAAADLFGVVNVLLVMAATVGGLGLGQILHARQSARAKWVRIRTRHRLGPEALPKPKPRKLSSQ